MMVMDDRTISLTYVIPDLHGRCDLLERALKAIEERHPPIEAVTVVFLGDYIDRGFESQQVLHTLMNGPPKSHWNWIVLRGNHEDIMLQAMRDIRKLQWWLGNGGGMTLESFGVVWAQVGDYVTADTRAIPEDVLDWLDDLPLVYQDKHRTFVHAGVDPDRPLDRQSFDKDGYEIMLWKYYRPNDHRGHGDSHVVHGHHSHHQGPLLLSGRTNLDTGAWQTGRLVIGVFDDDIAGGPIDTIEIVGPKYGELPEFAAMQAEKDDAQEREKRMTPHLAAPTRDSQFWGRGGRAILLSA